MTLLSLIRMDPTSIIADIIVADSFDPKAKPPLVGKSVQALTETALMIDELYHSINDVVDVGRGLPQSGYLVDGDMILAEILAKLNKEREHLYSFIVRWVRVLNQVRSAYESDIDEDCLLRRSFLAASELRHDMSESLSSLEKIKATARAWKADAFRRSLGQLVKAGIFGLVLSVYLMTFILP
ncbi:hypothetical protein CVT26_009207 [Gymnopilus dilepis]|uniref:Uncharacterized protein n=1 Tax=Gymnopilus dilepis TaxID=231916 RepID=A0A409WCJ9_9AGAR|nr:hypothetical protein CVT26_009207 [Gymnopilus dilepis]